VFAIIVILHIGLGTIFPFISKKLAVLSSEDKFTDNAFVTTDCYDCVRVST
jgi:hypothetical protein